MGTQTIAAALVTWYAVTVIMIWQTRATADSVACERSSRLATVLQYAPYKVRATAMTRLVPTIIDEFGIDVEFFETDHRVTNRFNLTWTDSTTVEGETNWIGFRVQLHDPANFRESCLSSSEFAAFEFLPASGAGRR